MKTSQHAKSSEEFAVSTSLSSVGKRFPKTLEKPLSAVCGVYFVAGELSRAGYIALATNGNTKGPDIVVSNHKFSKTVNIEVKTRKGKQRIWPINKPKKYGKMFYVFVALGRNKERPEYYVVPYDYVCDRYEVWQSRNKSKNRWPFNFTFKKGDAEKYKDKWTQLGLN